MTPTAARILKLEAEGKLDLDDPWCRAALELAQKQRSLAPAEMGDLVQRLEFIANETHKVIPEEIEEVCQKAADMLRHEGSDLTLAAIRMARKQRGSDSEKPRITAEQLAEIKDQCWQGLRVAHDCPAMFALSAIYADLFNGETNAVATEKQQHEYICKCGVRVTPHRCQTETEF